MAKNGSKKKRPKYGEYCSVIKGKLYAIANIPIGNGKYRQKRKRVENRVKAQQWVTSELEKSHSGEDVFERSRRTFKDLAGWYKKEFVFAPIYKNGKKVGGLRTWKKVESNIDRLCRYFGDYNIKKISIDVLRRYKQKQLAQVSITSVNRDFALIRRMFKKALRRKWLDENPFDFSDESLVESALEGKRAPRITTRLAKRLLARSRKSEQPLLHYLVLVMMHTGARPSEAYPYDASPDDEVLREPLRWASILEFDFAAVRLVSYKGKIREERIVPTTVELERGLRRFYAETSPNPDDLLFPITTFKRSWATLCKSVSAERAWIRDFRHYYNSYIAQRKDITDMERMLLLGHTELETNMRYTHLDENFIKKYRRGAVQPIVVSEVVN